MAFGSTFNLTTLNGNNGFRLDGIKVGGSAGQTLGNAGDVNGDGYDDLLVANFTITGAGAVVSEKGDAFLVYGGPSGFAAALSLGALNGTNGTRFPGVADGDKLAFAGPAGDVNGDGFADMLFIASTADTAGRTNNGAAYVVYGKAGGYGATFDLATLNGTNGFRVDGVKDTVFLAFGAGVGDTDGDGYDDLLFSANFGNPSEFGQTPNGARVGISSLVYGGPAVPAVVDLNAINAVGTRGVRQFGAAAGDDMGLENRRGLPSYGNDINGDGFADLLLSSVPADPLGRADAGEGYVVFGAQAGFVNNLRLGTSLTGANGFKVVGQAGERIAITSLGDINGDGVDDLAVSSRASDVAGTDAGRLYVVYGKTSGWAGSLDLATLSASAGFTIDGLAAGELLSLGVGAVGDMNGDGIDELVVTSLGAGSAGRAYVIYGTTAARGASFNLATMTAAAGLKIDGEAAGDAFGWGPTGPDINGDGLADLAIGATGVDVNGMAEAGAVYVVFGQRDAAVTSTAGTDSFTGTAARDIVNLLAGNDTARGLGGDDLLRGGPGTDTSAYDGTSANYEWWSVTGDDWRVKDLRTGNPDGVDLLTDIEQLQFSDATVKIAGLTTAEKLTGAYSNILRSTAVGSELTFLNGLIASVNGSTKTLTTAIGEIVAKADQTTAVAAMSYQFFLSFVPSKGGFDYLVSPQGPNPNNINSAYYQSFNIENRYINFAVNLGKAGEGAPSFLAEYGAKTLFQATQSAYIEIFGGTVTDSKINTILDTTFQINGQTVSRADYFALYGGDGLTGIGTKAAMVGWLLTEAAKADLGMYAKSSNAFLTDLADGAQTLVDIVGDYGMPGYVFNG